MRVIKVLCPSEGETHYCELVGIDESGNVRVNVAGSVLEFRRTGALVFGEDECDYFTIDTYDLPRVDEFFYTQSLLSETMPETQRMSA